MEHRIVSVLGDIDWTSSFGKKSSETSFTTYNLKKDDRIVSIVEASKYPDKVWSLLFSIYLGDQVLLRIGKLDRDLGETLIALDLMAKTEGFKWVSPEVDLSKLSAILKDNVVSDYLDLEPDQASLREWLFTLPIRGSDGPTMVVVDQSFNVKGVGTVVLGFVMSGSVRKHQDLKINPGGKTTQVRSIQVHDIDFEEAPNGARVGLAMKNISPEDLPRGSVLSDGTASIADRTTMDLHVRTSPFWKGGIEKGMRLHALCSLQFEPCHVSRVERLDDSSFSVQVQLESPMWTRPGDRIGLAHLDSKSFRLFASGETV